MTDILAYGSLMWDNALATYRGEAVRVDGFRRAFVGQNTTRWGSPEHPCPQIGLVQGGNCDAVLFELPRGESRQIRAVREERPPGTSEELPALA
jgi:cation transport regulator ChaC